MNKMQKIFIIIENDRLLSNLIEEQISVVFEKKFNIKFLKSHNIKSFFEYHAIDLIIANFKFINDNYDIFRNLENEKKSKIIILFDDGVDRSQLKKYSKYNFVVKPFKLKQLIDIIKDFFISYETKEKNIKITYDLILNHRLKFY